MDRAAEPDTGPGSGPDGGLGERWRAPTATGPVRALVAVPGSKSMTNRALVLAALADGPTPDHRPAGRPGHPPDGGRPARARQPDRRCDRARAEEHAAEPSPTASGLAVTPGSGRPLIVDVGNAGTVMRFVPPVAALASADVEFTGDRRAAQRPVGQLLAALREFGVRDQRRRPGRDPVHGARPGRVRGRQVTLDASGSSPARLRAAAGRPRYQKGAEIRHEGPGSRRRRTSR